MTAALWLVSYLHTVLYDWMYLSVFFFFFGWLYAISDDSSLEPIFKIRTCLSMVAVYFASCHFPRDTQKLSSNLFLWWRFPCHSTTLLGLPLCRALKIVTLESWIVFFSVNGNTKLNIFGNSSCAICIL